ncbi:hypothetical protein CWB76_02710 [Pseudoalteromonas sp. S1609]|uniref:class I SAM-dependent methyltransferase n=1 Tax=Pseudoalteromonas sp. S1609 TaxID=579505 RepID=UPI00110A3456|nr:class I SAM-dependent methyltransferase [Pseudoalteromonas sp. S1609]TMP72602.1 hypothetical protein CWB76_02710 [Pseudoalteromonas sp. S1609]
MKYDRDKSWNSIYAENTEIAYPPEAVIRIFLGQFPKLEFLDKNFQGKKILDVGFGDGRNFPLFNRLGLLSSGVEITKDIVNNASERKEFKGQELDLRIGSCEEIPFEANMFDYLISWNSSYYMSSESFDYQKHIDEFVRVTKPKGYLIVSVPTASAFIYESCEELEKGYVRIKNDYFGVRNGQVMRRFEGKDDFLSCFSNISQYCECAEIKMDWFGLAYNWYVAVIKLN